MERIQVIDEDGIRNKMPPIKRKRQKGEKAAKQYATKKVSFLDQTLKVTKDLPPPCTFNTTKAPTNLRASSIKLQTSSKAASIK